MFPPRLCNAICRTAKFQNIYINIPAKKLAREQNGVTE